MDIDVSPRIMIGIYFESYSKACDFATSVYDIDEEELEECHLCELEEDLCNLVYEEISGYSDQGGILGLPIERKDLIQRSNIIDETYNKLFSKIPVDYHDQIEVHIWEQYW